MNRTFSIKTLGCKLNQYESSRIAHDLVRDGWQSVPFGEAADIVIVNTCTVTDRSDKKCRNYIRQGARFARTGTTVVTGCLARRDADGLRAMPQVGSLAAGTGRGEMRVAIGEALGADLAGFGILENGGASAPGDEGAPLPFMHTRGFLKIQDGCDGRCSYCIVPSVRGEPKSRDFGEILEHARALVDSGCPELVLTGITIGRYGNGGRDLPDLVEALCAIPGDFRVRITSIEPKHVTGRLIDLIGEGRVCRHIHIPLQSGSDRVLARMNRPYTAGDFIGIVCNIRKKNPEIAIGTDIIIGFPGEDDVDFQESLEMVERAGFAYVHQFSFSPRTGTPAAAWGGHIPERVITKRSEALKNSGRDAGLRYRGRFAGRILPCVIEKQRAGDTYTAVSDNYIKIELEPEEIIRVSVGRIVPVRITGLTAQGARGERTSAPVEKRYK